MTIIFVAVDVQMWRHPTIDNEFRAFIISLPYLFVLFTAMIVSTVV